MFCFLEVFILIPYAVFLPATHGTWPMHLVLLDLNTLLIFCEANVSSSYKLLITHFLSLILNPAHACIFYTAPCSMTPFSYAINKFPLNQRTKLIANETIINFQALKKKKKNLGICLYIDTDPNSMLNSFRCTFLNISKLVFKLNTKV
jgi:hypothetical protein